MEGSIAQKALTGKNLDSSVLQPLCSILADSD